MKKWLGLLFILPLSAVSAEELVVKYNILQIINSHNIVMAQQSAGDPPTAGSLFLINFEDGKQCTLKVKNTKDKLIALDSSLCAQREQLNTKLSLEPALTNQFESQTLMNPENAGASPSKEVALPTTDRAEQRNSHRGWRSAAMLYYSTADKVIFKDGYLTSNSGSGRLDTDFTTTKALGLSISLLTIDPDAWGASITGGIESSREVNSITYSGAGGSFTGITTGVKPKITFFYAEGAMLYRWKNFYVPLGINISSPVIFDAGAGVSVETRSALGVRLGMGYFFNDYLSVEFNIRTLSLKMNGQDSTTNIDYGNGTMTGTNLGLKLYF